LSQQAQEVIVPQAMAQTVGHDRTPLSGAMP
jgi:hypothetical protein